MSEQTPHTTMLRNWLDRMQAGDGSAQDELLRSVARRLEVLTRKMLRDFQRVGRFEQTDDILQNAMMRLLRALPEVRPDSMREFYSLAATQIRRELLDLARHYFGPQGTGAHHKSSPVLVEGAAAEDSSGGLDTEKWQAFHHEVDKLPAEEREVVSLIFYHGWTQVEVADLFKVSERTIRRYWQSAMLRLHNALKSYPG